ncbi:MAG: FeoB-associated Cys-rich membrane protein [Solobacterium sp.]|nr:FeoB-associated Cys-rich membrane protein [Solobacterium sp.]
MANGIVAVILSALIFVIVRNMVKRKARGNCGCGCGGNRKK